MFFHSARSRSAAIISGVTDVFGVQLINQSHPFPLMIEEEEKIHGALLSNTTHGALLKTFGSMRLEHTQVAWMLGALTNVYGSGEANTNSNAIHITNRLQHLYDRYLSRALSVHETFAKYCAYSMQHPNLGSDAKKALYAAWSDDIKRYPLLDELSKALWSPFAKVPYEITFSITYSAAKSVLNICDLDRLLEVQSSDQLFLALKNCSPSEDFVDRFRCITALIKSSKCKLIFGIRKEKRSAYFRQALEKHGLYAGAELDAGTLSARSGLLGKRIERIALGEIFCHLEESHVGWKLGGWPEIDDRFLRPDGGLKLYSSLQSIRGLLGSDPSLNVAYDIWTGDKPWSEDQLRNYNESAVASYLFFIVADMHMHIECYTMLNMTDGSTIFFVHKSLSWPEFNLQICSLPKNKITIITFPPGFGLSASMPPKIPLHIELSKLGTVIFLEPVFIPSVILGNRVFSYTPSVRSEYGRDTGRGPVCLIDLSFDTITISASPKYAVDIINKVIRNNIRGFGLHPVEALNLEADGTGTVVGFKNDEGRLMLSAMSEAIRAYKVVYGSCTLPGKIPMYDPNNLFEAVVGNGEG